MDYSPARIDRNALFAINQCFDKVKVSEVRTQYHRAKLNAEDLRHDLFEYSCKKATRYDSPIYWAAVDSVKRQLDIGKKIIPLTHGAVADHPDFPGSKSPGLPYKLRGFKSKRDAVSDPVIMHEIRKHWYDIVFGREKHLPDVACFARAQICSRDKNKIRATWGYPLTVYMTEGQYFYPVLKELKELPHPIIAYGVEMTNGGMHYINSIYKTFEGAPFLMGDWKTFDKRVPAWLIRDAFKIIEEWIDFTHVQSTDGKIWPVKEHQSRKRWRVMVDYFINTPVRMADGSRFMKHGGVPSGSCWTNIIDSIVNAIVMRCLVYEQSGQFPLADIYLGDDSVIALPERINLDVLASDAYEKFGFVFSAQKSYVTTNPANIQFLGYLNNNGQPQRPLDGIIASAIYPERTVLTKLETITRLVGQAFATFDGVYALNFLQAADILRKEEALEWDFIEKEMQMFPARYKYLAHLGIDVRLIRIPRFFSDTICLATQPGPPRKVFKPIRLDYDALAKAPPW